MSSQAIMALRSKGPQDVALIVDPEVTFWKSVFPRHTNFALEDAEVNQSAGMAAYGQTVEFKLPRSGDLISKVMAFIQVDAFPKDIAYAPFAKDFGRILIDNVELSIGGYSIEKISGDFLHVMDKISRPEYKSLVDNMPVNHGGSVVLGNDNRILDYCDGRQRQFLYIPLEFTFTMDPGLALPMIALQYHDVIVKIQFATAENVFTRYTDELPRYTTNGTTSNNVKDWTPSSGDASQMRWVFIRNVLARRMDTKFPVLMGTTAADLTDASLTNPAYNMFLTGRELFERVCMVDPDESATTVTFKMVASLGENSSGVCTSARCLILAGTANGTFNNLYFQLGSADIDEMVQYADNGGTDSFNDRISSTSAMVKPFAAYVHPRASWIASPPAFDCKLVVRYVYLDDYERRQFALNGHEYLITETQRIQQSVNGENEITMDLNFNHPVKEFLFWYKPADLSWVDRIDTALDAEFGYNAYWKFWNTKSLAGNGHLFQTANLSLNAQNVFGDGRDPVYFSKLLMADYHTRVPDDCRVYVIPFSLHPESWKPTGSVNMSRLDSAKLSLKGLGNILPGTIDVYARSFNVLVIRSGMGGKRFAS